MICEGMSQVSVNIQMDILFKGQPSTKQSHASRVSLVVQMFKYHGNRIHGHFSATITVHFGFFAGTCCGFT
jgi:hypothetical protein